MNKPHSLIPAILLAGLFSSSGQQTASSPLVTPAANPQRTFDQVEAPVLKVFSAEDNGHRFVAYLVNWKGADVIVSDPLARSQFKEGDRIQFLAQKISLPAPPNRVSVLNFTLIDPALPHIDKVSDSRDAMPPAENKHLMQIVQGDVDKAQTGTERFYALGQAAKQALTAGNADQARSLATELEQLAPQYRQDWNYGNAIQDANQVLGRIALANGDIAEAKRRLLASADSPGSPQLNSFGPNMQLAKELLEKGERDAVLEYFNLCEKFWKLHNGRLAAWAETVKSGGIPDFGPNLMY